MAGPTLQAETAADGICAQNWVPPPGQERVGNGPPSPQQTLVLQLGSAGERRGARPGRPPILGVTHFLLYRRLRVSWTFGVKIGASLADRMVDRLLRARMVHV